MSDLCMPVWAWLIVVLVVMVISDWITDRLLP